jgi:adenine-specific DNA methylase
MHQGLLRAYGSDLSPVAVLISKALVEIPPKFAGRAPVHPEHDAHKRYRGAQGLAEDVREPARSHIVFKRADLVAKANKIVADYYGETLADGRRAAA